MKVCPDAIVDDGLLDVTVVGAVSKATFVGVFPRVFTGRHVEHPAVSTYRGSKIEVDATEPFWVYGDGEAFGRLPATFTVLAGALEVVAP
jgi:diacylglycerol kinase (ATP)